MSPDSADQSVNRGMSDGNEPDVSAKLDRILADPQLRTGLQELCRAGRVRAKGRRIFYRIDQTENLVKITEDISASFERIPADDWAALLLLKRPEGLRLEGSDTLLGLERMYEMRGWADVHFVERDLS